MNAPVQQLNAIHAMLAAGHRNLRIERHSLWLWGLPSGLLFAVAESILTAEQFPDHVWRASAWLTLIMAVLATVALIDWFWTRRVKETRDEAWSFIHRQVLKVQWLIMTMAALATFASFFYGGGYMICAVWLVFLGLSLYVHGLFSEELLEWVGCLCILLGVTSLFARLPLDTMRWLAASVFGLGLPLLSLMLDRGRHCAAPVRLGQMMGWLFAVLVLPLAKGWLSMQVPAQEVQEVSLEQFIALAPRQGEFAVALPEGTRIPVEVDVSGDIFAADQPVLPLTLRQPIELLWRDGRLTGDIRWPGQPWQSSHNTRWISIPKLTATLPAGKGPVVNGSLVVQVQSR